MACDRHADWSRSTTHQPVCVKLALAGVTLAASSLACSLFGNHSPTAPSGPPAPGSAIAYAAIGASDADGVGASAVCVPFTDCPNGTGYVPDTVRQLKAMDYTVTLLNLGIPTAVIGPDFEALGQQYDRTIVGNFIDQEMPFVPATSTLVTIFAGGNEVNTITAALGAGAGGNDPTGYIDQQVKAFGADFTTLLGGIRSRAGAPRIVALNLPNLGALPFLAGKTLQQQEAAQRASVEMTTTVINGLTSQGVLVVDLMCDPRSYNPANYSSDGFHPDDAGYAFIAGVVVQAVTAASPPAPQASCPPMTQVP